MHRFSAGWVGAWLGMGLVVAATPDARAIEYQEGRLQIHGFAEVQLRGLVRDYDLGDGLDLAQWYNVLNAELEYDLAPGGLGPFDFLSAFARIEVRYDCVWTRACGLFPSADAYGDRANKLSGRLSDAESTAGEFVGTARTAPHTGDRVLPDHRVGDVTTSSLGDLAEAPVPQAQTDLLFARFDELRFAQAGREGRIDGVNRFIIGPFLPGNFVNPIGAWSDVPNPLRGGDRNPALSQLAGADVFGTGQLPFRPAPARGSGAPFDKFTAQGLWIPDANLRDAMEDFDSLSHDQNFRQAELEWNRGAAQQDEKELRELYLDMELLDGSLWGRVGKQTIAWGKTELFRNQDQFNPQDLALASLPSLEESRIPLWAARFVYSFYDVGPLSDVRLEAAVNFDQFEPADLGDCGEPFTPDPVCYLKAQGLFTHGTVGLGLAGEVRPPDPWSDLEGLEGGLRLEFRWRRFSFAITDFYGFNDLSTSVKLNTFERNVDPATGRPRAINERGPCVTGVEPACLRGVPPGATQDQVDAIPNNALQFHSANQTLHAAVCASTVGLLAPTDPTCLTTLPNTTLGPIMATQISGTDVLPVQDADGNRVDALVPLNEDVADGGGISLAAVLTDEQEALLGCGPFYNTDCDTDGIDLLNAESSALFQSWLGFEGTPLRPAPGEVWTPANQAAFLADASTPNPGTVSFRGGPVATRLVGSVDDQRFVQLPGARSPFDHPGRRFFDEQQSRWSAAIDGCPAPTAMLPAGVDPEGDCAGAAIEALAHPLSGQPFRSELAAASWNFLVSAVSISQFGGDSPAECNPSAPLACALVEGFMSITGIQNPVISSRDRRFGRRDFIWHGAGVSLVRYDKNNILGFSMDFAEDRTKTNWGVELTWVNDVAQLHSREFIGFKEVDTFNLTVSTDRPTIINFLNANRSFFINQQTFIGYASGYTREFMETGPIDVLQTVTISTGYFQDRLNPAVTFVWQWQTRSGAVLASVDYRYSARLRVVFGVNAFAGHLDRVPLSINPASLQNRVGENRFDRFIEPGLSPARNRDELFLRLRYTF